MISIIRWLLFLPAAFVGAVLANTLFTIAGRMWLSDFVGISVGGATGAAAFIMAGLWVSPRRSHVVKWVLIIISAFLGVLSAVGAMLGSGDKMNVFAGVFMALFSFAFAKLSPDEITKAG